MLKIHCETKINPIATHFIYIQAQVAMEINHSL